MRLTVGLREQLHEMEATMRREEALHVTAAEIVRACLALQLAKPAALKREILRRRQAPEPGTE